MYRETPRIIQITLIIFFSLLLMTSCGIKGKLEAPEGYENKEYPATYPNEKELSTSYNN